MKRRTNEGQKIKSQVMMAKIYERTLANAFGKKLLFGKHDSPNHIKNCSVWIRPRAGSIKTVIWETPRTGIIKTVIWET